MDPDLAPSMARTTSNEPFLSDVSLSLPRPDLNEIYWSPFGTDTMVACAVSKDEGEFSLSFLAENIIGRQPCMSLLHRNTMGSNIVLPMDIMPVQTITTILSGTSRTRNPTGNVNSPNSMDQPHCAPVSTTVPNASPPLKIIRT